MYKRQIVAIPVPAHQQLRLFLEIIQIQHTRLQRISVGGLCPFGDEYAGAPYGVLLNDEIERSRLSSSLILGQASPLEATFNGPTKINPTQTPPESTS